MANTVLASGLKKIKRLQEKGKVFQSKSFTDKELTQLKKNGFLTEIIRGWYHVSSPADVDNETTMWYASFWEFVAKYLKERYKKNYCLNPDASLALHTGDTVVPQQIVVMIKKGTPDIVKLPHSIALTIYPETKNFPTGQVAINGVQVQTLETALCKTGPQYWTNHQKEAEIALTRILNMGTLAKILVDGKMWASAGRIVGALGFVERKEDAARLKNAIELSRGLALAVNNPFKEEAKRLVFSKGKSSVSLRLEAMWHSWREEVYAIGKELQFGTPDANAIEEEMEDKRKRDTYHSLSIEGYRVTDELIERVSNGDWLPEKNPQDSTSRDALAARGYYEAFENVKHTVSDVIKHKKSLSEVLENAHQDWFQALFSPSVKAGILEAYQLAGYRDTQVYLRGSSHLPLAKEELIDAMGTYFELLRNENDHFVCAVLGHHLFGFIHPYLDGNGRISRFIMNAFLVTKGYPWVIIEVSSRTRYMEALEQASVHGNIVPFAEFIGALVEEGRRAV